MRAGLAAQLGLADADLDLILPTAKKRDVALRRLGGGVLTHASDLDIIYLFTGTHEGESDGPRPLGATLYFNRLAQRVTAALSVPTAQGALYEVDTRLRPQGAQGPLAVSIDSFARYQREDAWTWEHMALTRARALVGSDRARDTVCDVVLDILCRTRDGDALRADVLKMRHEMAAHKPPKGPLDAKLLRGGLVDLEFLVHYLQLRHREALVPHLGEAIAQTLALAIDPYREGPDADEARKKAGIVSDEDHAPSGPLAEALAGLKKDGQ